jgi:hypothetical protein
MRLRIGFICVLGAWLALPAVAAESLPAGHFVMSTRCIACHSSLHAPSGEDISIGFDWRSTMMANSARDPYWHAGVRREVTDHPSAQAAIEDKCSTCHMPMARFEAAATGGQGQVFANLAPGAPSAALAADGVSCTVCHQITSEGFGEESSFDGGFKIGTDAAPGRALYGPHDVDAGRQSVMRSATQFTPSASPHIAQSELCATCHTLYTSALDETGRVIGSLPEQVPYEEWLHSEYREQRSCQSCHMPVVAAQTPIASVLGQARPHFSQHTFRGGNSFVLSVLNKYRDELGVVALPQELDTAIAETKRYLGTQAATLSIESAARRGAELDVRIGVASTTGHKLPTAYPSRRAWLHVVVADEAGRVLFESGAVQANGAIAGNDNDADPARFEPHYAEIRSADQVQIYESILADSRGAVTTGLLRGLTYAKDNRLLPRGFEKGTAGPNVAVHGGATADADFVGGGDRVRYRVTLPAATAGVTVTAELLYQSIGYRWADNLRQYPAAETQRFVRYYAETADQSAVTLARASASVARP